MLRRGVLVLAAMVFSAVGARGQDAVIAPGENLMVDGVPQIPAALAETAGRYGSYRSASFADWHPVLREMLIATRFGDTPQLHLVKMPGGERQQLTFFADAVGGGRFHPNGGDYIVFAKDAGGGEWFQLYRYDVKTGDVTLLTDGKARNLPGPWSSERRSDRVHVDAADREGYGFVGDESGGPEDGSLADETARVAAGSRWTGRRTTRRFCWTEGISINESYLWLVDTTTGEKTALTPRDAKEKVFYGEAQIQQGRERDLRRDG